jgi:cytochrome c-type biogenesis protein CcmH
VKRIAAVAVVAVMALTACGGAATAEQRARAIESRVWSPYCPGRLLADCTTAQAGELRTDILQRVRSGQTDATVLAWIRENFGEEALAEPPSGPRGLTVWLVPLGAIAAGVLLLGGLVRRWRAETPPVAGPSDPLPPMTPQERERWIRRVRDEVDGKPERQ